MNLEYLIYGLIASLIGLMTIIAESKLSKKEKEDRVFGYTEAAYVYGGWGLFICGILMILLSIS